MISIHQYNDTIKFDSCEESNSKFQWQFDPVDIIMIKIWLIDGVDGLSHRSLTSELQTKTEEMMHRFKLSDKKNLEHFFLVSNRRLDIRITSLPTKMRKSSQQIHKGMKIIAQIGVNLSEYSMD